MGRQYELSDQERELIVQLLAIEARELCSEIRRTDTARVRHELVAREGMVRDLLSRLQVRETVAA